jgi:hypothetical protein
MLFVVRKRRYFASGLLPNDGHCFYGERGKNINPYPANVENRVS